ncbi:hypothetical protein JG687_00019474 [Phytophthora cactorum]|uniref:Uncharacterized protein n=1 Tax=Phytophthora cactorum TaxID=29920 RepID=A0A8T1TMW2_9STRA|nr:hypothetical protein PC120_g15393 [Phytophthora cactorum]KAG3054077.1 hypothetical protein PC121_g16466 [Phytophthora cactorum]KAG4049344.1 hypothetical protein PC123_g15367 [Phytophthora cactorum]KAG6941731.1 hypothetical protein JG687_00019474 [Phytophthora cactorum]
MYLSEDAAAEYRMDYYESDYSTESADEDYDPSASVSEESSCEDDISSDD